MKTKYLLTLVFLLSMSLFTFAQNTLIPDPIFEQELVDQFIDSDGVVDGDVPTADISGLTTLDVSSASNVQGTGITDLTGIEDFAALEDLNCSDNLLDNSVTPGYFDLSSNSALTDLNCSGNSLATLDLTTNTLLETLNCSSNSLTTLTLSSANSVLTTVDCSTNSFVTLTVTGLAALATLDASSNASMTT